jgi:hypothetical protein
MHVSYSLIPLHISEESYSGAVHEIEAPSYRYATLVQHCSSLTSNPRRKLKTSLSAHGWYFEELQRLTLVNDSGIWLDAVKMAQEHVPLDGSADEDIFECNICFCTARDPVVNM